MLTTAATLEKKKEKIRFGIKTIKQERIKNEKKDRGQERKIRKQINKERQTSKEDFLCQAKSSCETNEEN